MKMPTIHCMDNGKILCGNKKANYYMELPDYAKAVKEDDITLLLGGCGKCEQVFKANQQKLSNQTK